MLIRLGDRIVNSQLVRVLTGDKERTMIEFDAQHKISVDLSIDEVADTLDPEFEENDD
jgi:hypothetical protein